jgi:hypothetical protein
MPVTPQYFVLFESEGMVKAITIPIAPVGFEFRGKTYHRCQRSLLEFNHLLTGGLLVGFQFLSPEDAGNDFLSSRFVRESRNVALTYWGSDIPVLEIYLGSREHAETDQASVLGPLTFATSEEHYILALPRVTWAQFELGFELVTDGGPSLTTTPAAR